MAVWSILASLAEVRLAEVERIFNPIPVVRELSVIENASVVVAEDVA